MNLSFEQIKNITVGASEIKKENGGICFHRFSDISKIIKEETQKFKNITFIDCFDFVPKKSEYFGDGRLHPNDEGFSHYFENLYKKICDLNIL